MEFQILRGERAILWVVRPVEEHSESLLWCMQQKINNGISTTAAADGTTAAGSSATVWSVSYYIVPLWKIAPPPAKRPRRNYSCLLLFVVQTHAAQLLATRVTLSTSDLPAGVGVQHLWVCDSSDGSCRVSIVSLHTNEPCVVESFHVCDAIVAAAETVAGCHTASGDKFAFADDTVWMATDDERWLIRTMIIILIITSCFVLLSYYFLCCIAVLMTKYRCVWMNIL